MDTKIESSGIVQPPDDLKCIIDKTANWVARNGEAFEKKIIAGQKQNPQFGFLRVGNPFFAYYQQKIREIRREELIAVEGDGESIENAASEKLKFKKTVLGELPDEYVTPTQQPKKKKEVPKLDDLKPPEPDMWVLEKQNISAKQDDVIKLSAQFIARNGRSFQTGLMEREHKNSLFDFLQPFHPLHGYFKKLVQDYTRVLLPERGTLQKLQEQSQNYKGIIDKIMNQVQWERVQRRNLDKKRQEEEAERNAMAMIDWHDFVVVQTIDWEEDEDEEEEDAPQPSQTQPVQSSQNQSQNQSQSQQSQSQQPPPPPPSSQTPQVQQPQSKVTPQQGQPPPQPPSQPQSVVQKKEYDDILDIDMDMEMEDNDYEPEIEVSTQIKMRPDFDPRARSSIPSATPRFIAPGGSEVKLSEASEHMKILLSNSQAREAKKLTAAQEREDNLAEDHEIVSHLRDFAQRRTDIFGDEEVSIGSKVGEKKKKETKPTWDGHSASAQRVALEVTGGKSVGEQIKAIQERQMSVPNKPLIGPNIEDDKAPLPTIQTERRPQPPPQPPQHAPIMPPNMIFPPPMAMMRPPIYPPPMAFRPPPGIIRPPVDIAPSPIPVGGTSVLGGTLVVGGPTTSTGGASVSSMPERMQGGEPPAKRQKLDDSNLNLVPEREWLEQHAGPVNVVVRVPNSSADVKSPWPLHGQVLRIQILISETVKVLKEMIGGTLNGMPANKQKLRGPEPLGYLKDNKSLAYYNFTDGVEVELGIKERGGRKK
eukprot:TRINITY_DN9052_c0_g1_i2.p1 TRINITY_DN9052_c0_g1~~TRINITY_DN9052_c0_g1_i2.p1  ORF type:complete len:761 (+),score=229.99 TRINITY_DN9052_c0_g1_i2:930-3212(+)